MSGIFRIIDQLPLANGLTLREYEVAAVAAEGISMKKIGARCGLEPDTVKVMLGARIYRKLGIHSQVELVRWWIENIELRNRGDCEACLLRQAHLAGTEDPQNSGKPAGSRTD